MSATAEAAGAAAVTEPIAPDGVGVLDEVTRRVQEQYRQYPYPRFAEESVVDGRRRVSVDYLRYIQIAAWPERRNLSGLRVLDAGCGTGQVLTQMAECHPEVRILGIDLSDTSLGIAQRQLDRVGATNAELRVFQIYDLERLGETFDVVMCGGVLHHLSDPVRGLRCLRSVLKDDGVLSIMVYGRYGRTGVYVMQDLIRMVAGDRSQSELAPWTRKLVGALPSAHAFHRRKFRDLDMAGDSGLVDLLLHPQDRSFTVPEIYEWLEEASLELLQWCPRRQYDPVLYVRDHDVRDSLAALSERDKAIAAELLSSDHAKHHFLACKPSLRVARPSIDDADWLSSRPVSNPQWALHQEGEPGPDGAVIRGRLSAINLVASVPLRVDLAQEEAQILRLCSGDHTAAEIAEDRALRRRFSRIGSEGRRHMLRRFLRRAIEHELVYLCP